MGGAVANGEEVRLVTILCVDPTNRFVRLYCGSVFASCKLLNLNRRTDLIGFTHFFKITNVIGVFHLEIDKRRRGPGALGSGVEYAPLFHAGASRLRSTARYADNSAIYIRQITGAGVSAVSGITGQAWNESTAVGSFGGDTTCGRVYRPKEAMDVAIVIIETRLDGCGLLCFVIFGATHVPLAHHGAGITCVIEMIEQCVLVWIQLRISQVTRPKCTGGARHDR